MWSACATPGNCLARGCDGQMNHDAYRNPDSRAPALSCASPFSADPPHVPQVPRVPVWPAAALIGVARLPGRSSACGLAAAKPFKNSPRLCLWTSNLHLHRREPPLHPLLLPHRRLPASCVSPPFLCLRFSPSRSVHAAHLSARELLRLRQAPQRHDGLYQEAKDCDLHRPAALRELCDAPSA